MKKLFAMLLTIGLMLTLVSAVAAQDAPPQPDAQSQRGRGHGFLREMADIVAAETGLTAQEIAQLVRAGSTLADVITANGGDVQVVTDQIVVLMTDRVNQAVANGKMPQQRADEILANLTERVTQGINGELRLNRGMEWRVAMGVLRLAAEQTGLTARDIMQEMRSGKSLADVLTAYGVDAEAFITSAVAALNERLDMAVTNGRLTQEEADQKLTQFEERLRERIIQPGGRQALPETTTGI
jgi:hypothetical protein